MGIKYSKSSHVHTVCGERLWKKTMMRDNKILMITKLSIINWYTITSPFQIISVIAIKIKPLFFRKSSK